MHGHFYLWLKFSVKNKNKNNKLCDDNHKKQTTKSTAEYEIVIYCFRACTILQNQET